MQNRFWRRRNCNLKRTEFEDVNFRNRDFFLLIVRESKNKFGTTLSRDTTRV